LKGEFEMNFKLNVKKETPVDAKMAKATARNDLYIAGTGANKRVFIVATNPVGTEKYFLEVNNLNPVWNLDNKATRQQIKAEAALKFGAGDYIAVEDIKSTEVSLAVTLK
jgi:hypothetical protein